MGQPTVTSPVVSAGLLCSFCTLEMYSKDEMWARCWRTLYSPTWWCLAVFQLFREVTCSQGQQRGQCWRPCLEAHMCQEMALSSSSASQACHMASCSQCSSGKLGPCTGTKGTGPEAVGTATEEEAKLAVWRQSGHLHMKLA